MICLCAEAVGETANAEVLALKKELDKLRAVALAPKRAPGRPKKPANAEAEGEPAPKRAKPGRPVGSKSLTPTHGRDAEANADTLPAKRKPGRPKTVKQEVEEEVLTPGEASIGRQPRAKERGPGRPRRGAGVAEAAAADGTQRRLSEFFDMSPQGNVDASASSLFARPFDNPVPPGPRWKWKEKRGRKRKLELTLAKPKSPRSKNAGSGITKGGSHRATPLAKRVEIAEALVRARDLGADAYKTALAQATASTGACGTVVHRWFKNCALLKTKLLAVRGAE